MDFAYETQGTSTYLTYQVGADDRIDSMSLGMLTNNKIPGLASTIFTQMDTTKYIRFNVSARVPVKQFFTGPVNKKRLIGVFNGIVDAMLSAEDYMIDPNTIMLDLEHIYADVTTCETVLICVPLEGYSNNVKLGEFFKNIMFNTQFDQTENCDHVAKIMNHLNSSPVFSLDEFKKVLDTLDTPSPAPEVKKNDGGQPVDKGGSTQPKVGGAVVTPSTEKGNLPRVDTRGENNGVSGQGVKPVLEGKGTGIATPPQGTPIKKEKKPGLFDKLFGKDSAPSTTKKVQPATGGYAVPGVETGGMAIPGQPDPLVKPGSGTEQGNGNQANAGNGTGSGSGTSTTPANGNQGKAPYTPRVMPEGKGANFGETTVLGGGTVGETTVLTANKNPDKVIAPHLIRYKNNEKISVNKPVFRIGKERSYVDYFIGDNTAISRSHADIITRNGAYYIVDTNSTNHTFVNGTMIQPSVETPLNHGDKIRLANEDFDFKLY